MKIVVIGETGLIGSKLVRILAERGHDAVAAAPSTGVDTYTGARLDEVLAGASVVVDVSNSPSLDDSALEFFRTATTNLLAAEQRAGVTHHVALSVVGTAELAEQSGYFKAKLAQEELISEGPIPHTIVHATQFFEFLATLADSATDGNTVRLPAAYFQPMAAADVARGVALAALGEPVNGIVEIGAARRGTGWLSHAHSRLCSDRRHRARGRTVTPGRTAPRLTPRRDTNRRRPGFRRRREASVP